MQAMEGAMDGTNYGSRRSRTNVQVMDQGAVEGDIDGATNGRSDSWYKRWITKQSMVQAMDQEAVEGAMEGAIVGTSDGSRSSRRRYGSGSCRSKHRCNWKEAYDDDRMMMMT